MPFVPQKPVTIVDHPEPEELFLWKSVCKVDSLGTAISECERGEKGRELARVIRTVSLSREDFLDYLGGGLVDSVDFFARDGEPLGGTMSTAKTIYDDIPDSDLRFKKILSDPQAKAAWLAEARESVVEIVCEGTDVRIWANPQGYGYARYVHVFSADASDEIVAGMRNLGAWLYLKACSRQHELAGCDLDDGLRRIAQDVRRMAWAGEALLEDSDPRRGEILREIEELDLAVQALQARVEESPLFWFSSKDYVRREGKRRIQELGEVVDAFLDGHSPREKPCLDAAADAPGMG